MLIHLPGPLLLGPDEERRDVRVVGGRLSLDRSPGGPPGRPVDEVRIEGWVLPGLVDAHCHVGLDSGGAVPPEVARAQAEADRDAGALLLRDAGSPGRTRWMDDEPDLPVILRAGRHIARSRRYLRNYGHEIEPEELTRVVRQEARAGDGWVKLVGDWIDRDLGDLGPCWPADALRAAIAAAHEEGARVTAHVFGEDCLPDLLEAGIDCLEHATGLTDTSRDLAAARGVPIVPTLVNIANFPRYADAGEAKFPRYGAHMRALHAGRYRNVARAYEAGIPVYCGTDAGGQLPHGLVAHEVQELITAGLPVAAALDAACWGARAWLGRPAPVEGGQADLVVYAEDPRLRPRTLLTPRAVILRGVPVAGESAGVGR